MSQSTDDDLILPIKQLTIVDNHQPKNTPDGSIHDYTNTEKELEAINPLALKVPKRSILLHTYRRYREKSLSPKRTRTPSPASSPSRKPTDLTLIQDSQKCPICNDWLLCDQKTKKYDGDCEEYYGWECHAECID